MPVKSKGDPPTVCPGSKYLEKNHIFAIYQHKFMINGLLERYWIEELNSWYFENSRWPPYLWRPFWIFHITLNLIQKVYSTNMWNIWMMFLKYAFSISVSWICFTLKLKKAKFHNLVPKSTFEKKSCLLKIYLDSKITWVCLSLSIMMLKLNVIILKNNYCYKTQFFLFSCQFFFEHWICIF